MKSLPVLLALMLALSAAAAQSTEENTGQKRDWLIMVYMDADNDLEEWMIDNIDEMELGLKNAIDEEANNRIKEEKKNGTVVTPEREEQIRQQAADDVMSRATIVVQIDRHPGYDDSNGNWTGTRRYVITPDNTGKINSTMVQDLDKEMEDKKIEELKAQGIKVTPEMERKIREEIDVNMGDPRTVEDFVTWAMENYPAEHTAVIYRNHGSGWKWEGNQVTGSEEGTESICYDESSNYDALTPMELDALHSSLPKLDIIWFGACQMQMMELAYQYQDNADIIIGSEQISYANAYNFEYVVEAAFNGSSPEELAKTAVNHYTGPTISAIRTEKIPEVTNSLDALLAELNSAEDKDKILEAYVNSLRFTDSEYGDLYTFADNIEKANLSKNITSAAKNLKSSIYSEGTKNGAVIAKNYGEGYKDAGGMSIWMPLERDKTNLANYADFGLSKSTQWDEHIEEEIETKEQISGKTVPYDTEW